jgi:hypothetical protein
MSMKKEDLAATLNGVQYPAHRSITGHIIEQAKAGGLVIVYGASDDLMEFAGAIRDEVGCYEGGEALVDAKGVLDRDQIDDDDDEAIADYVTRKKAGRTIEALWCAEDGISWTYKTDIPHATFEVHEGDEIYCRGIVFALADL